MLLGLEQGVLRDTGIMLTFARQIFIKTFLKLLKCFVTGCLVFGVDVLAVWVWFVFCSFVCVYV